MNVIEASSGRKFVSAAIGYHQQAETIDYPALLSEVLIDAGFKFKEVELGNISTMHEDQIVRPVNPICPFKVIGLDFQNHITATGWLNDLWASARRVGRVSFEKIVVEVDCEIQRSMPLKPIKLDPFGNVLLETPPKIKDSYFVDHTRDFDRLPMGPIGVHERCGGTLRRVASNMGYDAILCGECYLRIQILRHITSYGQFRSKFE